jgi:hypothetical protein
VIAGTGSAFFQRPAGTPICIQPMNGGPTVEPRTYYAGMPFSRAKSARRGTKP